MKLSARLILVIVLLAVTAGVASAQYTGPVYDTWVQQNGVNNPTDTGINVQDSTSNCTDTQVGYFQFDASGIETVSSASLVLTHTATAIGITAGSTAMTLYGVPDFDQATLNGSNDPLPTVLDPLPAGVVMIETKVFNPIPTVDTKLTWGGADAGLGNYIQSQANTDDIVTLAMSFSAGCNGNNSQILFYSQDYSGTNFEARRPALAVEGTTPTAVTMAESSAQRVAWPLYAGLGALALIVVAGVVVTRRKTA